MKTAFPFASETLGHRAVIAQLSADFHLPREEVEQVYSAELDRLRETARIRSYLGVLAAGHTRSILRSSAQPQHGME
jgi:hypothetical protein